MKGLIVLPALVFILGGCNTNDRPSGFENVLIRSLKENKFELLEPHLANREVYKMLAPDRNHTDGYIDTFLMNYKNRLKEGWDKIAETIKEKKIDLERLRIKEWLVHNPFKGENKGMQGGVLVYEYDGRIWDDLAFIITRQKEKMYLLEIPSPAKAFSFSDTTLRNSSDAKLYMELEDSAFRPKLQARVKEMIALAKDNKIETMAENAVYNGDDISRRWKSAMNPSEVSEFEKAGEIIKRINAALEACGGNYSFEAMEYERESEGVWVVQKLNCGTKLVYFAFLKINDTLLLGEVNAEEKTL